MRAQADPTTRSLFQVSRSQKTVQEVHERAENKQSQGHSQLYLFDLLQKRQIYLVFAIIIILFQLEFQKTLRCMK